MHRLGRSGRTHESLFHIHHQIGSRLGGASIVDVLNILLHVMSFLHRETC